MKSIVIATVSLAVIAQWDSWPGNKQFVQQQLQQREEQAARKRAIDRLRQIMWKKIQASLLGTSW